MNIIYIHTHDLGDWISPYGRSVETPCIEALAGESTVFSNAHSCAPTCSPSRAALLTGTNPHRAGMIGLAHRGFVLSNPSRHLAAQLRSNGLETVLCGIQHEFPGVDAEGFPYETVMGQVYQEDDESVEDFHLRRDKSVAEAASAWLGSRDEKRDFFLSVGFFQPHRPLLAADPGIHSIGDDLPAGLPQSPEVLSDLNALKTSIKYLDERVGEVIQALKDFGHWERSIILFTTDHGIAFPLHKCCLKDSGTRVSLMLRHPGMASTHGQRMDALVSHLDIAPTLYEWIGLETPDWCEGQSLTGLMSGKEDSIREEVYSEVTYHAAYEPMRSIRTDKHRLVKRFLDDGGWPLANIDDSGSKDAWLNSPSSEIKLSSLELYDLEQDPVEMVNMAGQVEYEKVQAELSERLHEWMKRTDDPLLKGHLKRPKGCRVNHRDSVSSFEDYFETA